jgi:hypothetical protein
VAVDHLPLPCRARAPFSFSFSAISSNDIPGPGLAPAHSSRGPGEPGAVGFGFFYRKDGTVSVRIAPEARQALKAKLHRLTSRSWGISTASCIAVLNRFIRGWTAYIALAQTPSFLPPPGMADTSLGRSPGSSGRGPAPSDAFSAMAFRAARRGNETDIRKGSCPVAGSYILARALPNAY